MNLLSGFFDRRTALEGAILEQGAYRTACRGSGQNLDRFLEERGVSLHVV